MVQCEDVCLLGFKQVTVSTDKAETDPKLNRVFAIGNHHSITESSLIILFWCFCLFGRQQLPSDRSVPVSSSLRPPPPVPSRNTIVNRPSFMHGYSSNGFGYGAYGSGYSGYHSGYSPYNMYTGGLYNGFGVNRFGSTGFSGDSPSGFVQQAELSSRQAFQSIESVVEAVVSVATMLESTFQAVYSSFRAVISVADHMSRLRSYFARIISALAVLRTLRWLVSKLLIVLRLHQPPSSDEQLWSESSSDIATNPNDVLGSSRTNWPVILFFMITVGGPWLLWKFLSSLVREGGIAIFLILLL